MMKAKAASAITGCLEAITPIKAAEWLSRNKVNRRLSERNVSILSRALVTGDYQINGDAIRFDIDGNLIDGQHRLTACMRTGIPFSSYVIRGLMPSAYSTIDQGKKRSFSDALSAFKEKNYAALAGATSLLWRYRNGTLGQQFFTPPTVDDLNRTLDANPSLRDSVEFASTRGHRCFAFLPFTIVAFCHFAFTESRGPELPEIFFDQLASGENLSTSDAVYWLRERLIRNQEQRAKFNKQFKLAITIKSWNSMIAGRPMKNLRFNRGEEFPEIL